MNAFTLSKVYTQGAFSISESICGVPLPAATKTFLSLGMIRQITGDSRNTAPENFCTSLCHADSFILGDNERSNCRSGRGVRAKSSNHRDNTRC
jgi:hypothetical protein